MKTSHIFTNRKSVFIVLAMLLMVLALGAVVMWLWNAILPELFAVPRLTYPKALGLFLLSRILFGSFRFGRGHMRHKGMHIKERFMQMSEEEKRVFKEKWEQRCGKRP